jgi:hypothetical protein
MTLLIAETKGPRLREKKQLRQGKIFCNSSRNILTKQRDNLKVRHANNKKGDRQWAIGYRQKHLPHTSNLIPLAPQAGTLKSKKGDRQWVIGYRQKHLPHTSNLSYL